MSAISDQQRENLEAADPCPRNCHCRCDALKGPHADHANFLAVKSSASSVRASPSLHSRHDGSGVLDQGAREAERELEAATRRTDVDSAAKRLQSRGGAEAARSGKGTAEADYP